MWDNATTTLKDYTAPHHRMGLFGVPLTDGLLLDTLHTAMLCGCGRSGRRLYTAGVCFHKTNKLWFGPHQ